MRMTRMPRSVALLALLMPFLALAGLAELTVGVMQRVRLDRNTSSALDLATYQHEVQRAIANLDTSGRLAVWFGVIGLLMLPSAVLVAYAVRWARPVVWMVWLAFLLGQLALMAQDSAIALHAYVDPVGNKVEADLINSMIMEPARAYLLYPAEVVALALAVWVAVLLRSEGTVEYLRSRSEEPIDAEWDGIMAVRRAKADAGG